jgi:hypothetical protein
MILKSLIACAGSTLLARQVSAGTSSKPSARNVRRKTMGGQKIYAHHHPKFDALLEKHFPLSVKAQVFQEQLRPFSAIIVNKSKVPVFGYRVKWKTQRDSGAADGYDRTIVKTPSDAFVKRYATLSAPLVNPGEALLVTPMVTLNSGVYRSGVAKFPDKTIFTNQLLDNKRVKLPVAAGYTSRNAERGGAHKIRLSAVVFATRVIGPKAGQTAHQLRNRMNAEHDVAEDLLVKLTAAKAIGDMAAMRAHLHNIRTELHRIPRSEATPYDLAKKNIAARLSDIAKPGRQGELVAVLRKLAKQPQSNLR